MELEGVVHNGVIVPDDATALPEGTRVRIEAVKPEMPKTFGERYATFRGAIDAPVDLAVQHEHHRCLFSVVGRSSIEQAADDATEGVTEELKHVDGLLLAGSQH